MSARRAPVIAVLVGLLVVAGVVDARVHRPHARLQAIAASEPTAWPGSTLSSTWYCTGATATAGSPADATIVLANASNADLHGTVTIVPSQGDTRSVPVTVPALGRALVRPRDTGASTYVSALVELDGGDAIAELAGDGPRGPSVTPCSSSASDHWYFAEGATTKDATEIISVFNPFPADAIVDLTFAAEDSGGQLEAPQGVAALVVPGRGMLAVPVNDFMHRRQQVAAVVTAQLGLVVAARLVVFDGSVAREGVTLALGSPSPGLTWYFPEGDVVDGVSERYQIFNPSGRSAKVQVALALEAGAASPITVTVPARSRATVLANAESRIPKGVAHAATVRSLNGVGVVVERTIRAGKPSARLGMSFALGARQTARRWALAAGEADPRIDEWVVLYNPGDRAADVSVTVLAGGQPLAVDGLQDVAVPPGQRVGLRIGDHLERPSTPMVVSSTAPIVVERDLYRAKGVGTAMAMGIPLAD